MFALVLVFQQLVWKSVNEGFERGVPKGHCGAWIWDASGARILSVRRVPVLAFRHHSVRSIKTLNFLNVFSHPMIQRPKGHESRSSLAGRGWPKPRRLGFFSDPCKRVLAFCASFPFLFQQTIEISRDLRL